VLILPANKACGSAQVAGAGRAKGTGLRREIFMLAGGIGKGSELLKAKYKPVSFVAIS
jgi:hypothetical protein